MLSGFVLLQMLAFLPSGMECIFNHDTVGVPKVTPMLGVIPNLFWLSESSAMVYGVLSLGILLSLALGVGWKRRFSALGLFVVWISVHSHHHLMFHSPILWIGALLLLVAALPTGEPYAMDRPVAGWHFPAWAYWGILFGLMGLYSLSGLMLLLSPTWADVTLLSMMLKQLASVLSLVPEPVQRAVDWFVVGVVVSALPLTLLTTTRRWIWFGLLIINFSILFAIDLSLMSLSVFVVHAFCFHQAWLPPAPAQQAKPVIFFDGVCSLCNHAVDFLMAEDHHERYLFASIQGETAKSIQNAELQAGKTMALQDGGHLFIKSEAVLRAAAGLGGHWRIMSWFRFVPLTIRDRIYMLVSDNRYAVFGKRDTCRMPTEAERRRFLN